MFKSFCTLKLRYVFGMNCSNLVETVWKLSGSSICLLSQCNDFTFIWSLNWHWQQRYLRSIKWRCLRSLLDNTWHCKAEATVVVIQSYINQTDMIGIFLWLLLMKSFCFTVNRKCFPPLQYQAGALQSG